MIKYIDSVEGIGADQLQGFFINWPNPPSQDKHKELLRSSSYVWLAVDEENHQVVGFITAISDMTLCAYIPLLEVLPAYQGKGIGGELVEYMLSTLKDYYMVDLLCDDELTPFYKRHGMVTSNGMIIRNYDKQSGK